MVQGHFKNICLIIRNPGMLDFIKKNTLLMEVLMYDVHMQLFKQSIGFGNKNEVVFFILFDN